jgi:hypothetical protein
MVDFCCVFRTRALCLCIVAGPSSRTPDLERTLLRLGLAEIRYSYCTFALYCDGVRPRVALLHCPLIGYIYTTP